MRTNVLIQFTMYYHVSTVQTRVALGTIFEIYIDFYMIVFGLERLAMFKFVKTPYGAVKYVVFSKANEVVYGEVY